jgi:hypothetical protein
VKMQAPGMPGPHSAGSTEVFICMYHFDHEAIQLMPLSGV